MISAMGRLTSYRQQLGMLNNLPPKREEPTAMHAIVFDLDGTLIDTAPDLHASLNHVLADNGRRTVTLEDCFGMIGGGARSMLTHGFAATGAAATEAEFPELLKSFLGFYEKNCVQKSAPFPGVFEALDRFRRDGIKLGLCTNKPGYLTDLVLAGYDLADYFGSIAGADRFPVRKPDPGHLLGVLDELGVEPSEAIMVGDSETDVATARAAGCPVVVFTFGYRTGPVEELGADTVIDDYANLPAAIDALVKRR